MNLTKRPPYQKGQKASKHRTASQTERWNRIRALGCIICGQPAAIHHCGTGSGGRKDHSKVLPLCHTHHQGLDGIHTLGRKLWQERYGTEEELIERVNNLINITI